MPNSDLALQLTQFAGWPASEFLLHRGRMLLLERLVDPGSEVTVCEWTVKASDAFFQPADGVPAYFGVEYMAQCVAVHAGVRARLVGYDPPLGFLLGTRHFKSSIGFFAEDNTYRATCRELVRDDNGMGSYDCTILLLDEVVAESRLAVLEKERGQERR